jgi:hypothetical protein
MSVSRALRRTFGRQLQFAEPLGRLTRHWESRLCANRLSPLIRPCVGMSDAEKPECHLELSRTLEVTMQICIERSEFEKPMPQVLLVAQAVRANRVLSEFVGASGPENLAGN